MVGRRRVSPWACMAATACAAVLSSVSTQAQPPAAINIHGQLLDASAAPITGTRVFQVTFFNAETNGAMLGSPVTGLTTLSANGLFNIPVEPPPAVLTESDVWYELGIDTDTPVDNDSSDDVFPNRIRLLSVPFALIAGSVDAAGVGSGIVDNTELETLDDIAGNVQSQLDDKADALDVYSQTVADDNFVDESGDSMSGPLNVDTVNEATSGAGVTVDGVTLRDSFVQLPQITAPGDTTDKLYNVAGNVFFNGVQLDSSDSGESFPYVPGVLAGNSTTGMALSDFAGSAGLNMGLSLSATTIASSDRFWAFAPRLSSYTIEEIFLLYNERDAWDDMDATLTATFEIRDFAGALQHTLFTTPDLQSAVTQNQLVDFTSSLPASETNRTVEVGEIVTISVTSGNNDASTMGVSILFIMPVISEN